MEPGMVYRFALASAITLYAAIVVGAFTKALGAGLACGTDWPTCKGEVFPSDIGRVEVALEYFHRVLAGAGSLLLVAAFAGSLANRRLDNGVFAWSAAALTLLAAQVALGMVVVKTLLEPRLSAIHTALATATIAMVTGAALRARYAFLSGQGRGRGKEC